MSNNFDILFEPVQIGPVVAPKSYRPGRICRSSGSRHFDKPPVEDTPFRVERGG